MIFCGLLPLYVSRKCLSKMLIHRHRMFANIDHKHPEVREDLFRWIEWLPTQMKLGGLRLDAIKHYSFRFLRDFVNHAKSIAPDLFLVGEYWREDSEYLAKFVEFMDHNISLFDVQLVSNFSKLSSKVNADLRTVLDDSLAIWKPDHTVVSSSYAMLFFHLKPDAYDYV